MSGLRVIAVENVATGGLDGAEPANACVWHDGKPHVYDVSGMLYYQREMFDSLDNLNKTILKGKYRWTDFWIEEGQRITRDIHENILVSGEVMEAICPLSYGENTISTVTLKLFHGFLEKLNRNHAGSLLELKADYDSGEFMRAVDTIIRANPVQSLKDTDYELIIRTRIEGVPFIANKLKSLTMSPDPLKLDQITYYFTRLFKLESANYIII